MIVFCVIDANALINRASTWYAQYSIKAYNPQLIAVEMNVPTAESSTGELATVIVSVIVVMIPTTIKMKNRIFPQFSSRSAQ